MTDELERLPDNRDEWLLRAVKLGDRIIHELEHNKGGPFAELLRRASNAGLAAVTRLLEADLTDADHVSAAREAQCEARRYLEMCNWIGEALHTAQQADAQLAEDAGEQLLEAEDRSRPDPPDL